MRASYVLFIIVIILVSCQSVPEKFRANKEKFIQVARENAQPLELTNATDLLEQAKSNNTEAKMKYLGVDKIETIYGTASETESYLDSAVVFIKSDYKVIYDFATTERASDNIKRRSGLGEFEKLDERLYMGRMQ